MHTVFPIFDKQLVPRPHIAILRQQRIDRATVKLVDPERRHHALSDLNILIRDFEKLNGCSVLLLLFTLSAAA